VIGELFRHDKHERSRRSLLVFLTPTIVHTAADTERILQNEMLRRRAGLADEVEAMMSPETRATYQKMKPKKD
jgi:type II secretory pathway component GspD/PulD (secretin)